MTSGSKTFNKQKVMKKKKVKKGLTDKNYIIFKSFFKILQLNKDYPFYTKNNYYIK